MKRGQIEKTVLKKLYYDNKLSMMDIAKKLDKTFPTIVYWMGKYNFPRRSNSDSTYFKQNPKGDPFNIKTDLDDIEKDLLLTGLMLYWAEGN